MRVAGRVRVFVEIPGLCCRRAEKAEREGFEPSRRLNTAYAISNPKPPVPLRAVPYRYVAYPSPKRGPLGATRTVAYRSVPAGLQYGCSKLSGRGSASLAKYSENRHVLRTLVAKARPRPERSCQLLVGTSRTSGTAFL